MQRAKRINRITRRKQRRSNILGMIILAALAAGGTLIPLLVVGSLVTLGGAKAVSYYNTVSSAGLYRLHHLPSIEDVQPTRILDRHGRVLLELSDTSRGLYKYVPFNKIPLRMRQAIVSSENKTFYSDSGVVPSGIIRSAITDLVHPGATSGGSSITQQLVKILVLGNQRGSNPVSYKVQQALIAYAMAQPSSGFSKDRILEMYLNVAFFGHQANGVEAAARVFFGKHIWQLDLAQCALLAGLVQLPSVYDPISNGPTRAVTRMDEVLGRMHEDGYISLAQQQAASVEGHHFTFSYPHWRLTSTQSQAPYWTDWIQHLLTYTYSGSNSLGWYTDPTLANIVSNAGGLYSGLTITTTLDLDMYYNSQKIMRQDISYLAGQNVSDAAIVSLQPSTGECLAMVGGVDYYGTRSGSQINMAAAPRQPGSSFKIFTYLTAFEQKGYYPAKVIVDEPTSWPDPSEPGGVYAPKNYDLSFHGAVTVREALGNSFNIPAVKTMADVGIQPIITRAEQLGAWDLRGQEKNAGLSATLGTLTVPLWQMAQAYNTLATGGVFHKMVSVLGISDANGNVLYKYSKDPGVQAVAPQYAYLMTSMLKDNSARQIAFGPNSVLVLDRPAAVKTGTTQNFKDNLTIGYTPDLLTATWVGNADNSPMNNVEGVDGAGPIWHDVMTYDFTHLNQQPADFVQPPGIIMARVSSSGYLASSRTAWAITDLFAAGSLPHQYDPGTGDNYLSKRHYFNDFSVDGGADSAALNGPILLSPLNATTPLSGTTTVKPGSVPSGYSGVLSQRPSDPNLCGGRYYTYNSFYENGQLRWRYTCQ